jgi:hypothetical protein
MTAEKEPLTPEFLEAIWLEDNAQELEEGLSLWPFAVVVVLVLAVAGSLVGFAFYGGR